MTGWEGDHERLRTNLGAYVLGGLPDDESAALEAHLATCAECRAEHDELLPAASVLGELKVGAPAHATAAPADLADRVFSGLAAEQDRERRTAWVRRAGLAAVAGAAAAAVLVVGLAVTASDDDDEPTVPLEAVAVTVSERGVEADADLVNHTWGVEVKLSGTGFEQGGRYRVALLGTDGKRFPAGEFVGTGGTRMLCNLNSSLLRDDASGFVVTDSDGDVVVRSSFA